MFTTVLTLYFVLMISTQSSHVSLVLRDTHIKLYKCVCYMNTLICEIVVKLAAIKYK